MSVSIIMPAYNAEKTILSSISSVLAQTFEDWELIIVDDNSTDNTRPIIKEIAENNKKIKPIFLNKNSGSPAIPRNVGTENANYRYIAFLDADDLWMPNKLKLQISYMEHNKLSFSCTGYQVQNLKMNIVGRLIPPKINTYHGIIRDNTIGCLTVIYDSTVLGKRLFPHCGHEDYALWLDILREGHIVGGVDQILGTYRLQENSVSSNKIRVLKYFLHIYNKRHEINILVSLFYVMRYAWIAKNKYGRNGNDQ